MCEGENVILFYYLLVNLLIFTFFKIRHCGFSDEWLGVHRKEESFAVHTVHAVTVGAST